MVFARVKHEYEGRFLLGTSTCMDLTVEQKEHVTEELYSALAESPGSAYTAEVWLVASHYQYWLCSPKEAPTQLHGELASWHITEATTSSIFIEPYLHILSREEQFLLKRAYKPTLNRKLFISPAQLKAQEQVQQIHRTVPEMFFKLQAPSTFLLP